MAGPLSSSAGAETGRPHGGQASPRVVAVTIALMAAVGLSHTACNRERGQSQDPAALALVNGEAITRPLFEAELQDAMRSPEGQAPSTQQVERVKRALLDSLIDRRLLLQAARESGLQVSQEEVDRRLLRTTADYPAGEFKDALAQVRTTLAELKTRTQELLLVEKLFAQEVYPRVAVTEAQIREAFEKRREKYQVPEQVRAAQIVVRTLDEARRMQALLARGEKFADLARKYSLSADAKVGGDLGFFPRGVMPPTFDQTAFKLSVGQVSEVVESEYGFHLFKLLERKPSAQRDFSDVRREIETELLQELRAQAEAEYIAELRKKARLSVNEPALAQVTVAAVQPRDASVE